MQLFPHWLLRPPQRQKQIISSSLGSIQVTSKQHPGRESTGESIVGRCRLASNLTGSGDKMDVTGRCWPGGGTFLKSHPIKISERRRWRWRRTGMNDESSAAVAIVKSPENPVSPIFDYFVSSPFSFDYTAIWDAAEWKHPETRQRNSLAPSLPPHPSPSLFPFIKRRSIGNWVIGRFVPVPSCYGFISSSSFLNYI